MSTLIKWKRQYGLGAVIKWLVTYVVQMLCASAVACIPIFLIVVSILNFPPHNWLFVIGFVLGSLHVTAGMLDHECTPAVFLQKSP